VVVCNQYIHLLEKSAQYTYIHQNNKSSNLVRPHFQLKQSLRSQAVAKLLRAEKTRHAAFANIMASISCKTIKARGLQCDPQALTVISRTRPITVHPACRSWSGIGLRHCSPIAQKTSRSSVRVRNRNSAIQAYSHSRLPKHSCVLYSVKTGISEFLAVHNWATDIGGVV
jgi:hypothetical protein